MMWPKYQIPVCLSDKGPHSNLTDTQVFLSMVGLMLLLLIGAPLKRKGHLPDEGLFMCCLFLMSMLRVCALVDSPVFICGHLMIQYLIENVHNTLLIVTCTFFDSFRQYAGSNVKCFLFVVHIVTCLHCLHCFSEAGKKLYKVSGTVLTAFAFGWKKAVQLETNVYGTHDRRSLPPTLHFSSRPAPSSKRQERLVHSGSWFLVVCTALLLERNEYYNDHMFHELLSQVVLYSINKIHEHFMSRAI